MGAAWSDRPVLLPKLVRAATAALLAAAVGPLAGCSASVKVGDKQPEEDDGWREPPAAEPTKGPAQRNLSSRPPTATFPGYRVLDEERKQSVVMVEVSRDVSVSEQKAEGRLVYVLSGTNVPEKVNRLPLVADHFGTAVSRIHLEQAGADAHLVIELRSAVSHSHRVVQTDNGMNLEVSITGEPFERAKLVAPR